MATLDIFSNNAFSTSSLTITLNDIPVVPTKIARLGLFRESGISTTTTMIEKRGTVLSLIPTTPRGGAGIKNISPGRSLVPVAGVRVQIEDDVYADEVQNIRAFGSETEVETVQGRVTQKLGEMAAKMDLTMEYQRLGAMKGIVLDADGVTELWDYFTMFGVTAQSAIDFDLENASPASGALRAKCRQVVGLIDDELAGITYDHVHCFASPEFFDKLMEHAEIRATYQAENAALLRDIGLSERYTYAGITFETYRGGVGATRFVAAGAAHFFPVGVVDLFRTVFIPADYMETVNTVGLPRYAKQKRMDYDRGVSFETQTNPIHLCTRPRVLVPATMT